MLDEKFNRIQVIDSWDRIKAKLAANLLAKDIDISVEKMQIKAELIAVDYGCQNSNSGMAK